MDKLKTTAEERARLKEFFDGAGAMHGLASSDTVRILDDLDTLLAEVERLRGEVASLALLVNPQAARDAAQEARLGEP